MIDIYDNRDYVITFTESFKSHNPYRWFWIILVKVTLFKTAKYKYYIYMYYDTCSVTKFQLDKYCHEPPWPKWQESTATATNISYFSDAWEYCTVAHMGHKNKYFWKWAPIYHKSVPTCFKLSPTYSRKVITSRHRGLFRVTGGQLNNCNYNCNLGPT